jgi:hypothetical protein
MEAMDKLNRLMAYAVKQFGRDRTYSIMFGASTPVVTVFEDSDRLAEVWDMNGEINVKRFPRT